MINMILQMIVLSWLISTALTYYGVTSFFWIVALTMPLSFALYRWLDIAGLEISTKKEGGE